MNMAPRPALKGEPLAVDKLASAGALWSVGKPVLEDLLRRSRPVALGPGEILVQRDEPYRGVVHILYDGRAQIQRTNGVAKSVHIGGMIGLSGYLDEAPYTATVTALSDAVFLEVAGEQLRELERAHADLANALHRIIVQKLRERRPDRGLRDGVLKNPVYGVMRRPVASCGPETTLQEAFQRMQSRRIGSLLVHGVDGKLQGILTTASVSEAVVVNGVRPLDAVSSAPLQPPYTVTSDTPLWKAEELQQRHHVRYLVVVDGDGHAEGVLSQTDIVRALTSQQSTFICRVGSAKGLATLAELRKEVVELATELRDSSRTPSLTIQRLSEAHLALQRRCVELTLEEALDEREGPPPCGFAFIVMGSAGRRETLLNPDQDNGLIIADAPQSLRPHCLAWFARFAQRANENLDRIGYALCPGDIMARNPMYRKTLSQWRQQIHHIAEHPSEKAARWSSIVFDFDTLYGDDLLTAQLRKIVLTELSHHQTLLRLMAEDDAQGRPAVGVFNRLISTTQVGNTPKIDLKRNGLRIIDDAARIFALHSDVSACNTTERLNALVRQGAFSRDFATTMITAFEELVDMLLAHQLAQARAGGPIDTLVAVNRLDLRGKAMLRIAMRAAKRFQERLQTAFDLKDF